MSVNSLHTINYYKVCKHIHRTFVIWMVSLAVRWQTFHWQHLIGFAILIFGLCEYNGIIPRCRRPAPEPLADDAESQAVNTEPEPTDHDVEEQ